VGDGVRRRVGRRGDAVLGPDPVSRAFGTPTLIRRMSVVRSGVRVGIVVALCQGWAAAGPRLAQTQDPAAKVTQMNREALAAIDKREFEKARELLKKALDFCQTSGLTQHPIAARTHVHMGVVIIEGFKNRELGMKQFAEALAIEPGIALTPSLATPELNEAFDDAKAGGGGGPTPSSAETGLPPPREDRPAAATTAARPPPWSAPSWAPSSAPSSAGFTYHTVSEVKQGNAIRITVNVDEGLKFRKMVLAYRPQGTSEFLGRQMDPVGPGAYSAEIPDRATTGSSVAYYIEAEDDDGQPVANRGTEERPLVIQLGGESRASGERSHATVEKHAEEKTKSSEEGDEDEGDAKWFASLQIGSGVGYTSGTAELNVSGPSVPGTLSGALIGQVVPEVGYWLRPDLLISGQGRIQRVSGTTEYVDAAGHTYNDAAWALAFFAKATWLFGSDDFRPFVSAGIGGGQIRHVVTFSNFTDCGASRTQACVDTVVAGPALVEGGGGFFYKLTSTFSLMLSSNLELAAPKFTVNVDLDAGLALNF
jgi:hypothetical protein